VASLQQTFVKCRGGVLVPAHLGLVYTTYLSINMVIWGWFMALFDPHYIEFQLTCFLIADLSA
jgi:hypothetical protein